MWLNFCLSHLSVGPCEQWQHGWLDPDAIWGGEWGRARYGCIRFWWWSSKEKDSFFWGGGEFAASHCNQWGLCCVVVWKWCVQRSSCCFSSGQSIPAGCHEIKSPVWKSRRGELRDEKGRFYFIHEERRALLKLLWGLVIIRFILFGASKSLDSAILSIQQLTNSSWNEHRRSISRNSDEGYKT